MGGGARFSSALSTKGGVKNFVTTDDIAKNTDLAQSLINEMKTEHIKFTINNIIFIAKLENDRKVFLETKSVPHIIKRHFNEFKKVFGIESRKELIDFLTNAISKGKLEKSITKYVNGVENNTNSYYYKGDYWITFRIADNGFIVTAHPERMTKKKGKN